MDSLRRRATFRFSEQDELENDSILDEQEQEEVIRSLREQSERLRQQQFTFVQAILLLSAILQIVHLMTPTKTSPLFVLFPERTQSPNSTIPFGIGFTLLSLFVHLNLALLFHPEGIRNHLQLARNPKPLPYGLLYALSAVSPTLSLFLRLPWQTTVWWLLTTVMVFVVQSTLDAAQSSTQSISELESMRYLARGA